MIDAELDKVEAIAADPAYQQLNVWRLGKESTDVIMVSPVNGLILMQGTNNTGFKHIAAQHLFPRSLRTLSKKQPGKSDFSYKWWDAKDFLLIAQEIFQPENLNTDDNTNQHLYELYEGDSGYYHTVKRFRLLVYRNRKIIHTIYPLESVAPKHPKGFRYVAGDPNIRISLMEMTAEIDVKYFDRKGAVMYFLHCIFNYRSRTFSLELTDSRKNRMIHSFMQGSFTPGHDFPNGFDATLLSRKVVKYTDEVIMGFEAEASD